jgi:PAS domain S-box-containing protein
MPDGHRTPDAEQALRESEQRYRQLFENMASGFALHEIICDAHGVPCDYRYLEVNPAFERLTGLTAKALVGRTLREVLPNTEERWISFFGEVALTGVPAETENYSRELDRWHEVRAFCPSIGRFAVIFSEVTARKRIEAMLRTREEDISITLRSIADAVIATDASSLVTRLNLAAEQLTGWSAGDAIGRPLTEVFTIIDAATRIACENPVARLLVTGRTPEANTRILLIARDGRERQITETAAPIRDDAGTIRGVVLVFRDVTEQIQLEDQVRQAQKMDTIGRLAGGVAHDFNNLLTGILGYADLLESHLPTDPRLCHWLDAIRDSSVRAADLTRQLLVFSRKAPSTVAVVDMRRILDAVVGILERTIDPRIALVRVDTARTVTVLGDASLLQSALLNIAVNARDAMLGGGTMTFTVAEAHIRQPTVLSHAQTIAPGLYLTIRVQDTGTGMDRQVAERLFEPFFTTKSQASGTGLGLSLVYGTITERGGAVDVLSTPGIGSSFTLYLPLTDAAAPTATSGAAPIRSHGVILLVEDEPHLRSLVAEQLISVGYEVLCASDGIDALTRFRTERHRIDAVVLDIIMPRLQGPETFRAMHLIAPQVPVVMVSGYGADAELLLSEGVKAFLPKPFRLPELSRILAQVMAEATPRTATPAP